MIIEGNWPRFVRLTLIIKIESVFMEIFERKADMRKVKKLPRAAFLGEKFPQMCVIHDCFQFVTKGHI